MKRNPLFLSPETAKHVHIDANEYEEMYANSIADPEAFWGEHGKRIDWIKSYTKVKDVSFAPGDIRINWYSDGTLNVSANCIDRHLETRGDQTAIIWEPDSPTDVAKQHYLQRCCREPQAWLTDVLSLIADHKITKLDELMPWNYKVTD
jgi:acetyl-CoA synthetase